MQEKVRLPASLMAAVLIAMLGAAALHLKITSKRFEEIRRVKRWSRPRLPVHPRDLEMAPEHPVYVETMGAVEELRACFPPAETAGTAGAVARLERGKVRMLYYLEQIFLDEDENPRFRAALLDILAGIHEEAMRQFLAGILADPREHEHVRGKALEHLGSYGGGSTFRVLRETYELEADFPDRHRLIAALAATRHPDAAGLLLSAAGADNPLPIRCAAAEGMGLYLDRPDVRERLTRLATADGSEEVRNRARESLERFRP